MRVLAALVVDRGGMVRVPRDVFDGLPRDHRLEVERERLTGDLIVRAKGPAGQVEELTFEQIRERYGKKNTEGEVDRPSDDLDDEKAAQQGSEDSEPPNSSVGIPE